MFLAFLNTGLMKSKPFNTKYINEFMKLPGWEVCHAESHLVAGAGVVGDHVFVDVPAAEHLATDQTDPEKKVKLSNFEPTGNNRQCDDNYHQVHEMQKKVKLLI